MSTTPKPKKIRARLGLPKLPDGTITPLLDASLNGLTQNATIFPKPPVDLKTYGDSIVAYKDAIPPAVVDGGKNAVALKNKLRDIAAKMYEQNAHYVEANCNDDMQTFLLSGFQPVPPKTPPAPVVIPSITDVVPGPLPGQLKVKIKAVKNAASYEIHYGAVPAGGGPPATWTTQAVASTKPVIISGLTSGTNYTFQVRALGVLGHTDFSDAVTRMAY